MSNFVVSARKYRPARFDEVVGQEHVSGTLKNALRDDHLAHAFLFCGPRGVGKTTCARILAKVINCTNVTEEHEPCLECASCLGFDKNASFNIAELDAASNNSVEHIRALNEQVRIPPQRGNYKVFIIDEVHMLSQQAFNAFLKTLEEPPSYAIFILATTEKHKIIPTILSRCQIYDFRRIQVPRTVDHLEQICQQEGIDADNDALHIIAQKADGALRDALSIFDRIVSFSGKRITYDDVIENLNVLDHDYFFRFVDAFLTEDLPQVLLTFDQVLRRGFDGDIFVNGLAEHLRNLLVCQSARTIELLELSENLRERYREQAQRAPAGFLLSALNLTNQCDVNYRMARNKRLHVEMTLIKITYLARTVDLRKNPPAVPTAPAASTSPSVPTTSTVAAPPSAVMTEKKTVYQTTAPPPSAEPASARVTTTAPDAVHVAPAPPRPAAPAVAEVSAPVRTSTLKRSNRHQVGRRVNLRAISATVDETATTVAERVDRTRYTKDNLVSAWTNYANEAESQSVASTLKLADLDLRDDDLLHVRVTSQLSRNTVLEQTELMALLRTTLGAPALRWEIEVDASKLAAVAPKKPRKLTDREKLAMMRDVNPQVLDLVNRLELRPR